MKIDSIYKRYGSRAAAALILIIAGIYLLSKAALNDVNLLGLGAAERIVAGIFGLFLLIVGILIMSHLRT